MRPLETDYAPYYQKYIDYVQGEEILFVLDKQFYDCLEILKKIPDEKADYSYAPGKWSVKEVIGHIVDTERIMAYRALRVARNDMTPLPGFEQDDYIRYGNFKARPLDKIIEEWELIRKSNMILFKSFDEEILKRKGIANKYDVSVLALLFVIAGHVEHHLRILKDKYQII